VILPLDDARRERLLPDLLRVSKHGLLLILVDDAEGADFDTDSTPPTKVRVLSTSSALSALHAALDDEVADLAAVQGESPRVTMPAILDLTRPHFSGQERRTLQLYATGMKLAAIAREMGVKVTTVKEYVERIRGKYAAVGRPAPTVLHLRINAQQDGLLEG